MWLLVAALVLVTVGVFAETRHFQFVNYDTPEQVSENPNVLDGLTLDGLQWALGSGATGNWIPLTRISHMLDVSLFGTSSGAHKLMSVGIHTANTVLLFALLLTATGYRWRSFLVAMVFAIHPLHVESVTWINQRKDVLSAFFVLLSLAAYGRYARRPSVGRYALVAVAFVCALMSKPMAVTLPVLLILIDYWPLRRLGSAAASSSAGFAPLRSLGAAGLEKLPLLVVATGITAISFLAQRAAGAVSGFDAVSLTARLSNAVVSYGVYVQQTIFPAGLAIFYPLPPEPRAIAAVAIGLALAAFGILCLRLRSSRPYLLAGFGWYLVALLPVLGLIRVGLGAHADRYTYLAQTGLVVAVVWLVADFVRSRPRLRLAAAATSLAICAAFLALTSQQLGRWRTTWTLFSHTLNVTNGNPVAHTVLGQELRAAGLYEEAAEHFRAALEIWPWDVTARNNLGDILFEQGQVEEAEAQFRAAIAANPLTPPSYGNLGIALREQDRFEEAVATYRVALQIRPEHGPLHMGLALALEGLDRKDEAFAAAMDALRFAPDNADVRSSGESLLLRLGKLDEAATLMSGEAGALDRAALHFRQGNALVAVNRFDEAVSAFKQAAALGSQDPLVFANLGAALASLERFAEAVEAFTEALRLNPDLTEVRQNLELALDLLDGGGLSNGLS